MSYAEMFFVLLAVHSLADFPLQGDFLAQAKDRHSKIGKSIWPEAMTAHALIHGGSVYIVTGSLSLGLAEVVAHWLIDFAKCEKRISFRTDQLLHVACKIVWLIALWLFA